MAASSFKVGSLNDYNPDRVASINYSQRDPTLMDYRDNISAAEPARPQKSHSPGWGNGHSAPGTDNPFWLHLQ
ncbi:hypothetical protein KSZ_44360 [Dictyobacter formicarum]|uniref:Uncharacterized protein n=1 Tax=Dictyobacter formicarum TaxID=2778368 RepID=A0ABQ3VKV3_9CHLR|nr:hypothetical protein KSZ_44360 [Dictyobacter formicarum]